MAGRNGAVPTLVIFAVNLSSLLVIMCQSVSSCRSRYADDARQFSSMAHCRKYICLSSRYADLTNSSTFNAKSAISVTPSQRRDSASEYVGGNTIRDNGLDAVAWRRYGEVCQWREFCRGATLDLAIMDKQNVNTFTPAVPNLVNSTPPL